MRFGRAMVAAAAMTVSAPALAQTTYDFENYAIGSAGPALPLQPADGGTTFITDLGDSHGHVLGLPSFNGPLGQTTIFGIRSYRNGNDLITNELSFDYRVFDNTSGRPNPGDTAWSRWTLSSGGGYPLFKLYGRVYIDNLTVSSFTSFVPEPAAWALMIVGVAAVGGTLRRRATRQHLPRLI